MAINNPSFLFNQLSDEEQVRLAKQANLTFGQSPVDNRQLQTFSAADDKAISKGVFGGKVNNFLSSDAGRGFLAGGLGVLTGDPTAFHKIEAANFQNKNLLPLQQETVKINNLLQKQKFEMLQDQQESAIAGQKASELLGLNDITKIRQSLANDIQIGEDAGEDMSDLKELANTRDDFLLVNSLKSLEDFSFENGSRKRPPKTPREKFNQPTEFIDRENPSAPPIIAAFSDQHGQFIDPKTKKPINQERFQMVPKSGGIEVTTPDGTVVRSGKFSNKSTDLSNKVVSDLQGKIVNNKVLINRIKNIRSKPEFFQLSEKVKNKVNAIREKMQDNDFASLPLVGDLFSGISKEEKLKLHDYQKFVTQVSLNLTEFIKAMSGAAVTEQEMKRLEKAMINLTQSETQFKASQVQVIRMMDRADSVMRNVLNEGLQVGTPEYGNRIDTLMGPTILGISRSDRDNELKNAGFTNPLDRANQLFLEGYLTKEEIDSIRGVQ